MFLWICLGLLVGLADGALCQKRYKTTVVVLLACIGAVVGSMVFEALAGHPGEYLGCISNLILCFSSSCLAGYLVKVVLTRLKTC